MGVRRGYVRITFDLRKRYKDKMVELALESDRNLSAQVRATLIGALDTDDEAEQRLNPRNNFHLSEVGYLLNADGTVCNPSDLSSWSRIRAAVWVDRVANDVHQMISADVKKGTYSGEVVGKAFRKFGLGALVACLRKHVEDLPRIMALMVQGYLSQVEQADAGFDLSQICLQNGADRSRDMRVRFPIWAPEVGGMVGMDTLTFPDGINEAEYTAAKALVQKVENVWGRGFDMLEILENLADDEGGEPKTPITFGYMAEILADARDAMLADAIQEGIERNRPLPGGFRPWTPEDREQG